MNERKHLAINQIESAIKEAGILEFSGDAQLLEWSKSTSRDGPKIKFMLPDDESIEPFETATVKKGKQAGQLYHIFAIRIDEEVRYQGGMAVHDDDKTEPNRLAQKMHVDGYFRNPKLWDAMEDAGIYTQDDHKRFVESIPCYGVGNVSHILCQGDVCAHHVKKANNSGVGIKPKHWYIVPLCYNHHMNWAHGSHANSASHEDREKMLTCAVSLTADRMKQKIKEYLGLESFSEINEGILCDFENIIGLM